MTHTTLATILATYMTHEITSVTHITPGATSDSHYTQHHPSDMRDTWPHTSLSIIPDITLATHIPLDITPVTHDTRPPVLKSYE